MSDDQHKHVWDVFITADVTRIHDQVISHSPCSHADDIIATIVYQRQGCKCGAERNARVAFERERFRGDDQRRAAGMAPLGDLPGSWG